MWIMLASNTSNLPSTCTCNNVVWSKRNGGVYRKVILLFSLCSLGKGRPTLKCMSTMCNDVEWWLADQIVYKTIPRYIPWAFRQRQNGSSFLRVNVNFFSEVSFISVAHCVWYVFQKTWQLDYYRIRTKAIIFYKPYLLTVVLGNI